MEEEGEFCLVVIFSKVKYGTLLVISPCFQEYSLEKVHTLVLYINPKVAVNAMFCQSRCQC